MVNFLQGFGACVAAIGAAVLGALFAFQEALIYHPSVPGRRYEETPADHALPYEDVSLVAEDGVKLHAWLVRHGDSERRPTFIYLHGNAGNLGHRLHDVRQFYASGFNLLVVSYRGYGSSDGSPSETGFRRDSRAALAYCHDRSDIIDTARVFIFGRSIGGAVAIATAAEAAPGLIAGIVVENTFTSIGHMIDAVVPFLRFVNFVPFFNRNPWNSIDAIRSVYVPILFISGLRDELVPPAQVKELHDAASRCRLRQFFTVAEGVRNKPPPNISLLSFAFVSLL
jgi:abhydrolase domain-containing protein 13